MRQRAVRAFAALFVVPLVVAVGCATSGGSGSAGSSRDVLTAADLEGMESLTAYEAIRRLRPGWLRVRGQTTMTDPDREMPRIYLDGSFHGDGTSLHAIPMVNVMEIRYLSAREATTRFGTGHTAGAILILTRRD